MPDSPRLRFANPDGRDPEAIAAIYALYVRTSTISFEYEPPSAAVIAERIAGVRDFYPYLVLEQGEDILAYAYATRLRARTGYDWVAETSVYVDASRRGQGSGARVYGAVLELLRIQGVIWAYGGIALPNPVSQRLHAKLGFEHIGCFPEVGFKHGQWCDVDWWRKSLNPKIDDPSPPRSIDSPELAEAVAELLTTL